MHSRELGLVLARQLFDVQDLHYGLWDADLELNLGNLAAAQQRYNEMLLAQLPRPAHDVRVLDIGCGAGHLLQQMLDLGYRADGVEPSGDLAEAARARLSGHSTSRLFECRFEDLPDAECRRRYDVALFGESFQYVPLAASLRKLQEVLKPGGLVIVCDFFKTDALGDGAPGDRSFGGGHPLRELQTAMQDAPFVAVKDEDLTPRVSPNLELANDLLMRRLKPAALTLGRYLESRYPLLMRLARAALRRRLDKVNFKYFSGHRNKQVFERYKTYRLLVYRLPRGDSLAVQSEEPSMLRTPLLSLLLFVCATFADCVLAQAPVRTKVFPGAQALPLMAGVNQGIFERHGIKLDLLFTTNSQELRDGLATGDVQVAHSAVDNAVAMVEMAKHDVIIVSGGDSSMNEFFVQPEIRSIADLKGKTVIVDAVNTAYALQAKKILRLNGLKDSDYTLKPVGGTMFRYKAMREDKSNAASMLNPPFSIDAPNAGLKSMGRAIDLLGPYQATGAFVLRKWAAANAQTLERYIAAQIESTRWVRTPANKDASVKMLVERFKLTPEVAARTFDMLMDPRFGLATDARFNMDGFKNVLALRAEIEGSWGGKAPAPERYLDMSYYERALKRLSQ